MALRIPEAKDVTRKKVLVRVDFNVPIKDGMVMDDTRIKAHLETLRFLKENGSFITLISHLGRPMEGRDPEFSLKPVAEYLSSLTGWKVNFVPDCIGEAVEEAVALQLQDEILVLENVRFYKEETKNDPSFAEKLAKPFEVFVMDAFSAAHRAHASTRGVADYLKSFAGFLIKKEIESLSVVRDNPTHPYVLILGGAKVSDKIGVIENLLPKVDHILIGGGMAYTFLKAKGYGIGKSLCEEDKIEYANKLISLSQVKGVKIHLPLDCVATLEAKADVPTIVIDTETSIPDDMMGLDIGPKTIKAFCEVIKEAKTIFWNGPMGVFELEPFRSGTEKVAIAVADVAKRGGYAVVGGGDTAAAVNVFGLSDQMTHVSTGGGASLEFMEGKMLPGIEPLLD
ncbi:MAG: phosphoglycerate kinase [Acetomicrobium sp.]